MTKQTYGRITLAHDVGKFKKGEEVYVYRKKGLTALKDSDIENIIDPEIRMCIKDYAFTFGAGSLAKAFKNLEENPIWLNKEKNVQIKKCPRLLKNSNSLIHIPPNERRDNEKLFVNPGSNFRMAIYEDPLTRERDYEIVSFFEAVQRKLKGQPLLPLAKGNKTQLVEFTHGDYFITYEKSPDEIDFASLGQVQALNDEGTVSNELIDIAKNRLYTVRAFTNGRVYLAQQRLAQVDINRDPEPLKIWPLFKNFKAVKVEVTLLGKIISPEGL